MTDGKIFDHKTNRLRGHHGNDGSRLGGGRRK